MGGLGTIEAGRSGLTGLGAQRTLVRTSACTRDPAARVSSVQRTARYSSDGTTTSRVLVTPSFVTCTLRFRGAREGPAVEAEPGRDARAADLQGGRAVQVSSAGRNGNDQGQVAERALGRHLSPGESVATPQSTITGRTGRAESSGQVVSALLTGCADAVQMCHTFRDVVSESAGMHTKEQHRAFDISTKVECR